MVPEPEKPDDALQSKRSIAATLCSYFLRSKIDPKELRDKLIDKTIPKEQDEHLGDIHNAVLNFQKAAVDPRIRKLANRLLKNDGFESEEVKVLAKAMAKLADLDLQDYHIKLLDTLVSNKHESVSELVSAVHEFSLLMLYNPAIDTLKLYEHVVNSLSQGNPNKVRQQHQLEFANLEIDDRSQFVDKQTVASVTESYRRLIHANLSDRQRFQGFCLVASTSESNWKLSKVVDTFCTLHHKGFDDLAQSLVTRFIKLDDESELRSFFQHLDSTLNSKNEENKLVIGKVDTKITQLSDKLGWHFQALVDFFMTRKDLSLSDNLVDLAINEANSVPFNQESFHSPVAVISNDHFFRSYYASSAMMMDLLGDYELPGFMDNFRSKHTKVTEKSTNPREYNLDDFGDKRIPPLSFLISKHSEILEQLPQLCKMVADSYNYQRTRDEDPLGFSTAFVQWITRHLDEERVQFLTAHDPAQEEFSFIVEDLQFQNQLTGKIGLAEVQGIVGSKIVSDKDLTPVFQKLIEYEELIDKITDKPDLMKVVNLCYRHHIEQDLDTKRIYSSLVTLFRKHNSFPASYLNLLIHDLQKEAKSMESLPDTIDQFIINADIHLINELGFKILNEDNDSPDLKTLSGSFQSITTNDTLPYPISSEKGELVAEQSQTALLRAMQDYYGFDSVTFDARSVPGYYSLLSRMGNDLGQCSYINGKDPNMFPGRGYVIHDIDPAKCFYQDTNADDPMHFYKKAWSWAARELDFLNDSKYVYLRGARALLNHKDPSMLVDGTRYAYVLLNEHFKNYTGTVALGVPEVIINEKLEGTLQNFADYLGPLNELTDINAAGFTVSEFYLRAKELGLNILNLSCSCLSGSLANMYPPGSAPHHIWERFLPHETRDFWGHIHKSHITGRYVRRSAPAIMNELLVPVQEAHEEGFNFINAAQNHVDIGKLITAAYHRGETVRSDLDDMEDQEMELTLDLEASIPPLNMTTLMLEEAYKWHNSLHQLVDNPHPKFFPVLAIADALDYSAMPDNGPFLDTFNLKVYDQERVFQLPVQADGTGQHEREIWEATFFSNFSSLSDPRFYDRKNLPI